MVTTLDNINLAGKGEPHTVEEAEQDLLFIGMHSSTGRLLVQFAQGEECVSVEIANPTLRAKMLSLLIDGVGRALNDSRGEEAGNA